MLLPKTKTFTMYHVYKPLKDSSREILVMHKLHYNIGSALKCASSDPWHSPGKQIIAGPAFSNILYT